MLDPISTPDPAGESFSKARQLLNTLLRSDEIVAQFSQQESGNARKIYSNAATLWLLITQRAGGGLTLDQAVKDFVTHHRSLMPLNRRVTEGTLSLNNSSYNKARKKIPLQVVKDFSQTVCDQLAAKAEPAFLGRRVFIIDGTTITLPPTDELKKAFPPARNQKGESAWPLALLLVAHEMQTGCAMVPQIDPMYGPNAKCETKQAIGAINQLPTGNIVMADSGFGIFSVAWQCQQAGQDFLFRLTKSRCKSHLKKAKLVDEGPGYRTHALLWSPSAKERKNNPSLPLDATIQIAIHQIDLDNGQTLDLITSLEVDASSAGNLYCRRYDVEFDIRDFKVTMDTENIRAKSLDTVMKELLGSVIAYNLVMQFRSQAAKLAKLPARRLSFSGVWLDFKVDLLHKELDALSSCRLAYAKALANAATRVLPNYSKKRSYPRVALTRRQKSTKFQKQQRQQSATKTEPNDAAPPPE